MDDKIAKLEAATKEAETQMNEHKELLEDAAKRLQAAKELLREMDPEDQAKIKVNDTKLPELISLHELAKEQYESSHKRFETNSRYLTIMKEKAGIASGSTS